MDYYKDKDWTYLGDGVYVRDDGYNIILHVPGKDEIFLDPHVWAALKDYVNEKGLD